MRELDLLLGHFADAHLVDLSEEELGQFEALLDCADQQIFAWYAGREELPGRFDTPLFARLKDFDLPSRIV